MNRQYLLTRLGRQHHIVYSTGAWTVWERHTDAWKQSRVFGRAQTLDNVVVEEAPRFLLRWPKHAVLDKAVIARHAARLRRLATSAEQTPLTAMLFHPSFHPYLEFLKADLVAYHAYDLFSGTPGWNSTSQAMEDKLLRRADLVSTVTPAIAQALHARVAREIRMLPNGVDIDAFAHVRDSANVPADIAPIPRPRFGYVGSLHPQVDFGLVATLAKYRPHYHFVLVGGRPEVREHRAEVELARCRALPNIHFLGEKNRRDVPCYLAQMDGNLMLYRLSADTWIGAIHPLKLHEYFATGSPVISVDLEAVREYASVVTIARSVDEWLAALDEVARGASTGSESARREIAKQNGWNERAQLLERWLEDALAHHGQAHA